LVETNNSGIGVETRDPDVGIETEDSCIEVASRDPCVGVTRPNVDIDKIDATEYVEECIPSAEIMSFVCGIDDITECGNVDITV